MGFSMPSSVTSPCREPPTRNHQPFWLADLACNLNSREDALMRPDPVACGIARIADTASSPFRSGERQRSRSVPVTCPLTCPRTVIFFRDESHVLQRAFLDHHQFLAHARLDLRMAIASDQSAKRTAPPMRVM